MVLNSNFKQQDKLLRKILKEIDFSKYNDIYIESHSVVFALWGELLAKKVNARHFIHNLSESLDITEPEFLFLNFKHERKELAGIVEDSLKRLFRNYKALSDEQSYVLKAVSEYPIQPISYDKELKLDCEFSIGTIGRIDKNFVLIISKAINQFALNHPNHSFSYLIIGGCPKGEKKFIKLINENCYAKNLKCTITGRLYPIPTAVVDCCDVFISTAGSARVSAQYGKLTISVDTFTGVPIGIFPIETTNTVYSDLCSKSLIAYLDEIFFVNGINNQLYKYNKDVLQVSVEELLKEKFSFIFNNKNTMNYYTFNKKVVIRKNDILKSILVRILLWLIEIGHGL